MQSSSFPDGATGLDAARAIGPKLAEQAVLVRTDGRVQDVRLPLEDGQRVQFLTTRDTKDPDALYVLRHSSAHLLAEAVRRLYPGVKIAIGPPIENGFYYDFEFPEPIREEDLEKIEAEIDRELAEGREWSREEISREEAKKRFAAEGEPYKVELVDTAEGDISLYTQGDFTDLCRGPHLQSSKPIKALKLTGLAGAYWRGDSTKQQLTRIYGTAFYDRKDLDAYLEQLEEARKRDHRRLGSQLDLFHFDEHSPGSPFWHPKGMTIFNTLEDLRRRENAQRGYVEVKTPLIYDKGLWEISGHWEKFRENMFLIPMDERPGLRDQADELPGAHAALRQRAPQLSRPADPLRGGGAAPPERARRRPARADARAVRHPGRRAHLLYPGADPRGAGRAASTTCASSSGSSTSSRARSSRRGRRTSSAPTRSGTSRRGSSRRRSSATSIPFVVGAGEGSFYGPKIDLHITDVLGRSWQLGTIQLDRQMPARFGLTYMGPDNTEHPVFVIHRALFGSFERFIGILIEHYGGAFPFWLAPVQVRILPVGEAHHDGAQTIALRLREAGYRVEVDEPTETIGKRIRDAEMREDPDRHRLRRPRERGEPGRPGAGRGPGNPQPCGSRHEACYPLTSEKQERTRSSPPGPRARVGFNRVGSDEDRAAACSGFCVFCNRI